MFRVEVSTVNRWARTGRIAAEQVVTTPTGRLRYRAPYIRSLLTGDQR